MNGKKKVRVGYLGPGTCTFGYQALMKAFAPASGISPDQAFPVDFLSHPEICEAVGSMKVRYGVIAIENTIDGVVSESARAVESIHSHLGLSICGEITVPIEMYYMSKTGEQCKKLLSHSTAIGQCKNFVLELQKKRVTVEMRKSTGEAAEEAFKNSEVAALASKLALEKYQLKLIEEGSKVDHKTSTTRFWILSKRFAYKKEGVKYKTCFVVNLDQSKAGVLHKSLGVFASRNVPVHIVYPIPILAKNWEYSFLIEVGGYVTDEKLNQAWHEFKDLGISLQGMQFLGSYPDVTNVPEKNENH